MDPVEHIAHNVETIATLRARAEEDVSAHQRRIEWATASLGRPRSMYLTVIFVAAWVAINGRLHHLGRWAPDPPPFSYLQGLVGLAALLMTFMVLTTQNRQSKHAEQRAQLDLQVNLLAEQKVAKLIALFEELRRDIPIVPDRVDPIAQVMKEPLNPEVVLTALEDTFEPREESRDETRNETRNETNQAVGELDVDSPRRPARRAGTMKDR